MTDEVKTTEPWVTTSQLRGYLRTLGVETEFDVDQHKVFITEIKLPKGFRGGEYDVPNEG